jgi:hypothetical protein
MDVDGKREYLDRGEDEEVVALEKVSHDLIPLGANYGSGRDVVGRSTDD